LVPDKVEGIVGSPTDHANELRKLEVPFDDRKVLA